MYTVEYSFDFDQAIDPYRSSSGGQTVPSAYLWIDDDREMIRVIVEQTNPGETGYSPDDLLAIPLEYGDNGENFGEPWTPDPDEFKSLMESEQTDTLLQRIAAGYSQQWPNADRPGDGFKQFSLDADAQAALDDLNTAISELHTDTRQAWNCDDWFNSTLSTDLTTAEELDTMIANPTGDDTDAYLTDDSTEYLMSWFADALQNELHAETAESDLILHRGAAILTRRDDDGNIEQILEIVTPAGNRWQYPNITPTDLITQTEAARIACVTVQAVNNAIRAGKLRSYRVEKAPRHRPGGWLVSMSQVRAIWEIPLYTNRA